MQEFVSVDGRGTQVGVKTDTAHVTKIEENGKGQVNITFQSTNPKLKYPYHGWTGDTEPIVAIAREAQANGTPVDFRVEIQRKATVPNETPIAELRGNTDDAKKNTKVLLVGINGVLTSEAVTNPKKDPESDFGRVPDTDDNPAPAAANGTPSVVTPELALEKLRELSEANATRDLIAAVAAHAVLNGATLADVNKAIAGEDRKTNDRPSEIRPSFSSEAPQWKLANSDGRPNLGSLFYGAGTATEKFVHGKLFHLIENGSEWEYAGNEAAFDQTVAFFAQNILGIADFIQTSSYGNGFHVDRSASSHTRIRDIVFTTIDRLYPIPVNVGSPFPTQEDVTAWVRLVGTTARARFQAGLALADSTSNLKDISYPNFFEAVEAPAEAAAETVSA